MTFAEYNTKYTKNTQMSPVFRINRLWNILFQALGVAPETYDRQTMRCLNQQTDPVSRDEVYFRSLFEWSDMQPHKRFRLIVYFY